MRVAIFGSTGFTGQILLRLLSRHPRVQRIIPISESQAGEDVFEQDPGLNSSEETREKFHSTKGLYISPSAFRANSQVDLIFSALPHLVSAKKLAEYLGKIPIVDLSADFRIADPQMFEEAYGAPQPAAEYFTNGTTIAYGLPEWNAQKISTALIIANPGCYPTAILLAILPVLGNSLKQGGLVQGKIIINAMSGVSGAGRKLAHNTLFTSVSENMRAYLPGRRHRHFQEIQYHAGTIGNASNVEMYFTPHIVPLSQGLAVSINASLCPGVKNEDIQQAFSHAYAQAPFVRLCNKIPETRHVRSTNRCDIFWHIEDQELFLFSVIDNLYKGAASQALQNMNIRLGLDETLGLQSSGEI